MCSRSREGRSPIRKPALYLGSEEFPGYLPAVVLQLLSLGRQAGEHPHMSVSSGTSRLSRAALVGHCLHGCFPAPNSSRAGLLGTSLTTVVHCARGGGERSPLEGRTPLLKHNASARPRSPAAEAIAGPSTVVATHRLILRWRRLRWHSCVLGQWPSNCLSGAHRS